MRQYILILSLIFCGQTMAKNDARAFDVPLKAVVNAISLENQKITLAKRKFHLSPSIEVYDFDDFPIGVEVLNKGMIVEYTSTGKGTNQSIHQMRILSNIPREFKIQ